ERVAKHGLANVQVVRADARLFLARQVPSAGLRAAHAYFPDPWRNARPKKRRVFSEPFVAALDRALEPGRERRLVSGAEGDCGRIRSLIAGHPGFEEAAFPEPDAPKHDLDYLTSFERKYRIQGRSLFRARYWHPRTATTEPASGTSEETHGRSREEDDHR